MAVRDAAVSVGVSAVEGVGPIAPPVAGAEITRTGCVPGVICPVGVAQVTTVPSVVGSEVSGTGASVVSGEFGRVVAENGLGPYRGDVTIAPGVVGSPMAVLPMVETCARPALHPPTKMTMVKSKRRIPLSVPI